MVRIRVRVGPKGQVVIPKALSEAYRILKGVLLLELAKGGILLRGVENPEEVVRWTWRGGLG
ncbi:AbrB/MazE/SpoVT family DNA-binding domain-containing protein [Infirmifilum sp. NZ]|uniref:AbrB/MazE/SpoVT family DNA-binding domain-containing protein n=1 Tax=Infirmifilum sp. NZ TaxID=2926850 RepID=UPI003FA3B8A6